MPTHFTIIPPITGIRRIASGNNVKCRARLIRDYGPGNWRKMSGNAKVQLATGGIRYAEIHWYEANGVGQFEHKIKSKTP